MKEIKEFRHFWKDRNNLLLDFLQVYAITSKENINIPLEKEYERLSFSQFRKWNRKRSRGFWYAADILKDALKSLSGYIRIWYGLDFLVPKSKLGPLLIELTPDLFLVVAPRLTWNVTVKLEEEASE